MKTTVIVPGQSTRHYWRDLWHYRELFLVLAWRDVAVRYKQTVIGVSWALLQPLLTMLVFTVIFGKVANLAAGSSHPYALLVYAGLLPWLFFAGALVGCAGSLTSNTNLISKVYFPRLIVPVSAVVVSFVDFAISLAILAGLMIWYQQEPSWRLLALPLFVFMAFLASLGPGLWIASLNVKYRDFRYIVPFLVQFGLYVSPVGYSATMIPEDWRLLYSLNPMVSVIDGFRWAILGGDAALHLPGLLLGLLVTAGMLWLGISRFRSMERHFVDII